MAVIKQEDLFDFPGYNKAIKDAEQTNKEFGATVENVYKRMSDQYKSLKGDLDNWISLLKKFNPAQDGAVEKVIKYGEAAIETKRKSEETRDVMVTLVNTNNLANKSYDELTKSIKHLLKDYKSLSGASDDVKAKQQALLEEIHRQIIALNKYKEALKLTNTALKAAEGSYQSYQQEMTEILVKIRAMPDAFDKVTGSINKQNKEAVALHTRYNNLDKTLKAVDASMGKYHRNVGNYSSATFSLTQVLRELPSLGINASTFFLAISNNLPILFDEFNKLSKSVEKNTDKVMGNHKALSVFARSLLSTANLLTFGVTALTLYGPKMIEFVANLFKGKEALDETAEAQTALSEAIKSTDYQNAIGEIGKLEHQLDLAKKGIIDKDKYLQHFNKTLGLAEGSVKGLNAAEQWLIDNKQAYIDMVKEKAMAQVYYNRWVQTMTDLDEKKLDRTKDPGFWGTVGGSIKDIWNGGVTGLFGTGAPGGKRGVPKFISAIDALQKEQEDEMQKQIDFYLKKWTETDANFAKMAKDLKIDDPFEYGDKSKSEKKGKSFEDLIREQQSNLEKLAALDIKDLELQKKNGIISETEFQDLKLAIRKKYSQDAINLELKLKEKADKGRIADLKKEATDAEIDYKEQADNHAKKIEEREAKEIDSKQKSIQVNAEIREKELEKEYQESIRGKLMTDTERQRLEREHQAKIDAIVIQSIKDRIGLEIDEEKKAALQKELADKEAAIAKRLTGDANTDANKAYLDAIKKENNRYNAEKARYGSTLDLEKKHLENLIKIRGQFYKDATSLAEANADDLQAIREIDNQREKLIAEEKRKLVFDIFNTGLQIASEQIDAMYQNRITALENEKAKELELAGNNAQAKEAIEEKYQKRIAEQKRKAAVAEKAFSLFQIAINTAQAVMSVLSTGGGARYLDFGTSAGILSAFVTAQGALQAAVVAARPIPKYAKGRWGGPEQLAIVDEQGPELIVDKHGKLKEIGGKGSRLAHLSHGDSVINATRTTQILKSIESRKITDENERYRISTANIREGRRQHDVLIMREAVKGVFDQKALEGAFEKAVKKLPIHQTLIDEEGQRKRVIEGDNRTTYLNNLTKL